MLCVFVFFFLRSGGLWPVGKFCTSFQDTDPNFQGSHDSGWGPAVPPPPPCEAGAGGIAARGGENEERREIRPPASEMRDWVWGFLCVFVSGGLLGRARRADHGERPSKLPRGELRARRPGRRARVPVSHVEGRGSRPGGRPAAPGSPRPPSEGEAQGSRRIPLPTPGGDPRPLLPPGASVPGPLPSLRAARPGRGPRDSSDGLPRAARPPPAPASRSAGWRGGGRASAGPGGPLLTAVTAARAARDRGAGHARGGGPQRP